jgi:uncharacterized protein YaiL (DUF2058 family)
MAISLQDQLLKAGLASKKQANKAKAEKRKKKPKNTPVASEAQQQEQAQLQAEKREKDKQLNLQKEQQRELKASISQARQIIESNKVSIDKDAQIRHQFSHLNFVKTIFVDKQLQSQLFCGQLTVAFMDEQYYLIPTDQAHRVHSLQSDWIVELPEKEILDEDDPYAGYEIPDDLMW